MVSLSQLPNVALTLILVAAFFVAGFLVVDGLDDNITNNDATQAVGNVTEGMSNVTSYAPTWGTLIGVGVLLAIIIGAFALGSRRL